MAHGLSKDAPRTIHRHLTDCPKTPPRTVHGHPDDSSGTPHKLFSPWTVGGVCRSCPWGVHGQCVRSPWIAHGGFGGVRGVHPTGQRSTVHGAPWTVRGHLTHSLPTGTPQTFQSTDTSRTPHGHPMGISCLPDRQHMGPPRTLHTHRNDCSRIVHGRLADSAHGHPTDCSWTLHRLCMETPRIMSMLTPRTVRGGVRGHNPWVLQRCTQQTGHGCPRTPHRLPTDSPRTPRGHPTDATRTHHGTAHLTPPRLFMGTTWAFRAHPTGRPCAGQSVGCALGVGGFSMDNLWGAHGQSVGRPCGHLWKFRK